MGEFGIGQPVPRFEDPRLLRGGGRYINDVNVPGQAYGYVLRSPHAHARFSRVDVAAAKAVSGVLAIVTGDDLSADGLGTPKVQLRRKRLDGAPLFARPHPGLARERVRYVGDPVAFIVAETLDQAKDAAELIDIDYTPLPAVTDTDDALKPDAPRVWDENPDNVSHVWQIGDRTATETAFGGAVHRIRRRYTISRVHAQFMEPRGALGIYDARDGRFTLYADVQYPHRVRGMLAGVFKVPEHRIRVVAGDVGGGFGTKGWQYVEHRLVLYAARKLGRPVKWQCERSEALLADEHGRDCVADAELALDASGKFVGLRVHVVYNVGAYISSDRNLLSTFTSLPALVGTYLIPAAHVGLTVAFSNSSATAPYRGAGRPEAIYVVERLIDDAARELRLDRVELRRRNLIPSHAMPHKTVLGFTYDCGDFPANMERALRLADHGGTMVRRANAERRGKLFGIGIVNPIERAASPSPEFAEVRFDAGGSVTLLMGTMNQGQGHETAFKQILCDRLGIAPDDIRFIEGDTDQVAFGMGTMGSRSAAIGGTAVTVATDKIVVKATKIAAHALEVSDADLVFADGRFTVAGTDRSVGLKDVARLAFQPARLPPGIEPGLYETGSFSPSNDTFPNGCHVAEVELDPETGQVELKRYVVVDDVGTVLNPLTLKGQIHGGVAQGLGQALLEQVVYDRESGQLLTASFMDYAMPRAGDVCAMEVQSAPTLTKLNPLGVKGAGEAGTVGALACVMNAVMDALASKGVREFDMPATPPRIWRALTS